MEKTKSIEQTFKDLLASGKLYHALTYSNSTFKERMEVLKMLNKIKDVELSTQLKKMLGQDERYIGNTFSFYTLSTDTKKLIFHMTTLSAYDDFDTHSFSWWVKTLRPFIKQEYIDNSDSCTDSWLDNQLKTLEHGK